MQIRTLSALRASFTTIRLNKMKSGALLAAAACCLAQSSRGADLTPLGAGILGINDAIDTDRGTSLFQGGNLSAITDGDPLTRVDDWSGDPARDGGQGVSFVGIVWPGARYEPIQTLTLDLALFSDGGWFGTNGVSPAAGGPLTAEQLIAPTVQVSTNGGGTWQTVPSTTDYLTVLTGTAIGGGDAGNPVQATVTFTLTTPPGPVSGVRIIGQNGGTSDGNGFIGVFGLLVDAGAAVDSDNDGMADGWEAANGLVVGTNDAALDAENDGVNNLDEFNASTNPQSNDTDGDGFQDAFEIAIGSSPTDGTSVPNLARSGTGLIGTKPDLASGADTEQPQENAGGLASINDGIFTTRVDTYNGDGTNQVSFVGVVWDSPMTNKAKMIRVTFATFLDGGWFGPNGTGPGAGAALRTNHLTEPQVEVSLDGATWGPIPFTSDYVQKLTGHRVGGGTVPNPSSVAATFTLNQETNNIRGLRVIGTEGGQASGGFLGIFEVEVLLNSADVDNDGLDDVWERENGLIVGTNDAGSDADNDGLTNLEEFTNSLDPQADDTDGDGLNDGPEIKTHRTSPRIADTDDDGLSDGAEVNTHRTNPLLTDSDGDGFRDGLEVAQGTDPANASSVPSNIAGSGSGILGTQETVDSGEPNIFFNSGTAQAINDGDLLSRVDSFGGGEDTASFVGILWTNLVTKPIVRLELTHAIFFDGGWFGVGAAGPGAGGTLSATENLVEPKVQVSTNQGTNWNDVAFTSDYITALTDHPLPAENFGAPTTVKATFTLTTPQTNINGIRIIGSEGGTASGGFIGVFELAVQTSGSTNGTGGLQLINAGTQANNFQFQFASETGKTYQVQYKDAINNATWESLSTVTGDGTVKTVSDTRATPTRFYRAATQ